MGRPCHDGRWRCSSSRLSICAGWPRSGSVKRTRAGSTQRQRPRWLERRPRNRHALPRRRVSGSVRWRPRPRARTLNGERSGPLIRRRCSRRKQRSSGSALTRRLRWRRPRRRFGLRRHVPSRGAPSGQPSALPRRSPSNNYKSRSTGSALMRRLRWRRPRRRFGLRRHVPSRGARSGQPSGRRGSKQYSGYAENWKRCARTQLPRSRRRLGRRAVTWLPRGKPPKPR